jgi:hypothetical protein
MADEETAAAPRAWRVVSYLILGAVGLYGVAVALGLGLWRGRSPGEGLFPFLAAISMLAFAAAGLLATLAAREQPPAPAVGSGHSLWRVAAYLLALMFYALTLEGLGFVVATIAAVTFILRFAERYSWTSTIAIAVASAAFCHLLFQVWLGAILPAGKIWEWLLD